MDKKVKYIPDGYHTITPYLTVGEPDALIEFLSRAFGGELRYKHADEHGRTRHAEVQVGDSRVMIGGARGEWKPQPAMLYLYLPDCDAFYQRALDAGAKSLQPPATHFYGDRTAGVQDASGNLWWIGTHVEDVSDEEIARRAQLPENQRA